MSKIRSINQRAGWLMGWTTLLLIALLLMGMTPQAFAASNPFQWGIRYRQHAALYAVAFGNNIFVAVGSGGAVLTSSDGLTWTSQKSGATAELLSVAYCNNAFVVAGGGGTILTSPDGVTWTSQNSGTTCSLAGVAYGNNTYVAVGKGIILTSPDGVRWATAWTSRSGYGTFHDFKGVVYGNNIFVAFADVGYSGVIMTSHDGVNWTTVSDGNISVGAVYAKGTFVVAGWQLLTSPDGANWTDQQLNLINSLRGITYGNDTFVAVGYTENSSMILTSTDGTTWTRYYPGIVDLPVGLAYGNGKLVMLMLSTPDCLIYSTDFNSAPPAPPAPSPINVGFVIGQSRYYVGDNEVDMDAAPFIHYGRVLVPVRYLADALGAQTSWDGAAQKITISKGDTAVDLVIGDGVFRINGQPSQMDMVPIIRDGRTYLPARFVAVALGYKVAWDENAQTVTVSQGR